MSRPVAQSLRCPIWNLKLSKAGSTGLTKNASCRPNSPEASRRSKRVAVDKRFRSASGGCLHSMEHAVTWQLAQELSSEVDRLRADSPGRAPTGTALLQSGDLCL